jgi:hypothetical protein
MTREGFTGKNDRNTYCFPDLEEHLTPSFSAVRAISGFKVEKATSLNTPDFSTQMASGFPGTLYESRIPFSPLEVTVTPHPLNSLRLSGVTV